MSSRNAVLFASLVIATVGGGATGQPYQYGDYPLKPIQFSAGKSSAIISDSVERGASATYSLNAKAGQKAEFHLSSVEHNALFTVYLPGAALKKGDGGIDVEGETLPGANAGTGAAQWSGVLPKDGQYIIAVAPTRGGATYRLAVAIKRKWDDRL